MTRAKDQYRYVGHGPLSETPSDLAIRRTAAELKDKGEGVASLDLHGKDAHDARKMILKFVSDQIKEGALYCRIIHGKGTGKLHKTTQEVLENLKQQGVVMDCFNSQNSRLQGSAIMVMFKESPLE